jgi:proline iminopeptidase
MTPPATVNLLFPPLAPYASGQLEVGDGHQLYVEQCGNADGMPMVYLHGGPGSGCSPRHRQFFDPAVCRVVLFDQRGCGRSLPRGALHHNTTQALVRDMETLRQHLGIARWLVVGGSWGAGLALAYAAAHPTACLGLVLRGVFLGRASDVDWFFKDAAFTMPEAWQQLVRLAPGSADEDVLQWLHAGLQGASAERALACATAWEAWEQSLLQHQTVPARVLTIHDREASLALDKYRLQSHYLVNHCFWQKVGLLQQVHALAGLPTAIIHGRLDWICRAQAALDLHHHLPGSRLHWVEDGGHNPFEPAMADVLVGTINYFVTHGNFSRWGDEFPLTPNL